MFVVTAYFNVVRISMTEFFPLAITELAESSASVQRIQVSCTVRAGCGLYSATGKPSVQYVKITSHCVGDLE
jgi:hypothetical protein